MIWSGVSFYGYGCIWCIQSDLFRLFHFHTTRSNQFTKTINTKHKQNKLKHQLYIYIYIYIYIYTYIKHTHATFGKVISFELVHVSIKSATVLFARKSTTLAVVGVFLIV